MATPCVSNAIDQGLVRGGDNVQNVLQCVAVCCSVLRVLQCVAEFSSVLQCVAECGGARSCNGRILE